jgi:ERCC4-type nuclease
MIYVDSNEQAMCDIPAKLQRLGLSIIIATPPADQPKFDYIITADNGSSIGIERKEIRDYFQSKTSGHLDKQLYEYSSNFQLSFLAIIGNIQETMIELGITRPNFMGSYIGTMIKTSPDGKQGEIKIAEFITDDDFVLFLKMLHEKVQEGNFTRLPKFERHNPAPNDQAVNFLCGLPGIGPAKAKAILKEYNSVANAIFVLMLNEDSKWNVKGIGEKTLVDIKKIFNYNYNNDQGISLS